MARHVVSRADLADALGVHVQSIARRLTGEVAFDVNELAAIAPLLKTTPSALMTDAESDTSDLEATA